MSKYDTFLDNSARVNCCGCEACKQICPQQCITMEFFDDGFNYPVIDHGKCIECNLCKKVCPISESNKIEKIKQDQKCFYGWHMDDVIRHDSTSGGAFSAIAELVLEKKGSVYGAIYNEKMKVCHSGVQNFSYLWKLRQSKYVQSEIGNCYTEIKEKLNQEIPVLFSGTPCQVHGLLVFLQKKYPHLLTIDIVCHGVSSPQLFKSYLESLENRKKSKINKIRFRDKVQIGNFASLAYTTIEFENKKKLSSQMNTYLRSYINGLMQRESCEACPYSTIYRWSDITLGDFWGIENIVPDIKEEFFKGISLLIANTEKGKEACDNLSEKMYLQQVDISHAVNGKNQQLITPVKSNKKKIQFHRDLKKMPVELALIKGVGLKNYLHFFKISLKNSIKMIIPKKLYELLIKLLKRK